MVLHPHIEFNGENWTPEEEKAFYDFIGISMDLYRNDGCFYYLADIFTLCRAAKKDIPEDCLSAITSHFNAALTANNAVEARNALGVGNKKKGGRIDWLRADTLTQQSLAEYFITSGNALGLQKNEIEKLVSEAVGKTRKSVKGQYHDYRRQKS
jgi:hypothetical protein